MGIPPHIPHRKGDALYAPSVKPANRKYDGPPRRPMKVGILGSGDVGRSLGLGFATHGHDVMIGTRHPDKPELAEWRTKAGKRTSVGSFSDAAKFGDTLVLCTKGDASEAVIDLAGPSHFDGKVVIDVTNPLDFSKGMPPGLFLGRRTPWASGFRRSCRRRRS